MKTIVLRNLGCAVAALLAVLSVGAQVSQPGTQPATNATSTTHPKKHSRKPKTAVPEPVAEVQPPPPPAPNWPVNSQAEKPTVGWNGRELSVQASNSSLQQVLKEVSTATGLKVEGLSGGSSSEQRIYGNYGPAAARDVLSQLLVGSGYNVLMIGDSGEGTPRVLVLTAKVRTGKGAAAQGQNGQAGQDNQDQGADEELPEEPEQPEAPPQQNLRPQFGGQQPQGEGARSPQEIMQELQQRQLIMQQKQQQELQQQQQPQPQPQPAPEDTPQPQN